MKGSALPRSLTGGKVRRTPKELLTQRRKDAKVLLLQPADEALNPVRHQVQTKAECKSELPLSEFQKRNSSFFFFASLRENPSLAELFNYKERFPAKLILADKLGINS